MVRVLVRYENAGDVSGAQALGGEKAAYAPERDARVYEQPLPSGLYERAVAGGAAGEYGYAHQPAFAVLIRSGSSGSETRAMSAPMPRSLPTKFS